MRRVTQPKVIKVSLLNRKQGPWFYALMEREDGKKYHIVWKYKAYINWELHIKTFSSLPFIVKIDKENIINKLVKNDK